MSKQIGIIDADLLDNGTRHPNLALMKISGYQKELGNQVTLLEDYFSIPRYDEVYLSRVFDFTKVPIDPADYPNLHIGGTGYFWMDAPDLPPEIEHHMPDYHLYDEYVGRQIARGIKAQTYSDYKDYSIGFTTRGCFRKCPFCVNQKYDHVFRHSPVKEFFDPSRKHIYLWDDNFFGFGGWQAVLDELEETGRRFQFRQGLDVRLMTEEKARRLSGVKYHGDYIFAFDHISDTPQVRKGLEIWRRYSDKSTKLYVLSGFESQGAEEIASIFERIRILMEYQCLPYIMRHENYAASPYKGMFITLARWCNQPNFLKKKSFRQFCEANGLTSSAYRHMAQFEHDHPDIAKKYFDIRFDRRGGQ